MSTPPQTFLVEPKFQGERLDKFLCKHIPELSRTRLQNLLTQGAIHLHQGGTAHPILDRNYKISQGEIYTIHMPDLLPAHPQAESFPLHIYHEDADCLVLEKPAGMVVHPSPGHRTQTLVNALLAHCAGNLSGISGVEKPGIVHRLDKETSGLMIVAKNDLAHQNLSQQFAMRTLEKRYWAFVWGRPSPASGCLNLCIGPHPKHPLKRAVLPAEHLRGKESITLYRTLSTFSGSSEIPVFSLVECHPKTGRTHQIRVHCAHLRNSIMGDALYGHPALPQGITALIQRHALHAHYLSFLHPRTSEVLKFQSPLPDDMVPLWTLLGAPML